LWGFAFVFSSAFHPGLLLFVEKQGGKTFNVISSKEEM
jgi:hypothetical protein